MMVVIGRVLLHERLRRLRRGCSRGRGSSSRRLWRLLLRRLLCCLCAVHENLAAIPFEGVGSLFRQCGGAGCSGASCVRLRLRLGLRLRTWRGRSSGSRSTSAARSLVERSVGGHGSAGFTAVRLQLLL